jgi:hypothetical protein
MPPPGDRAEELTLADAGVVLYEAAGGRPGGALAG